MRHQGQYFKEHDKYFILKYKCLRNMHFVTSKPNSHIVNIIDSKNIYFYLSFDTILKYQQ